MYKICYLFLFKGKINFDIYMFFFLMLLIYFMWVVFNLFVLLCNVREILIK